MIKLNNVPEPPRRKPPKHLVWAETFDFTFPISMDAYIDRIKNIFGEHEIDLLSSGSDQTDLVVSRLMPKSPNLWIVASIQKIDQASVRVIGKAGVSQIEITLTLVGMFVVALIGVFVISPQPLVGICIGNTITILYIILIFLMAIQTKWMRSGLLKCLRQAGKELS
ncbi:MAG: hypothetical protein K8L97_09935 [Anaerolineae bacterium]|nr:hypothetical protein [Anaerolineae bacterium]